MTLRFLCVSSLDGPALLCKRDNYAPPARAAQPESSRRGMHRITIEKAEKIAPTNARALFALEWLWGRRA